MFTNILQNIFFCAKHKEENQVWNNLRESMMTELTFVVEISLHRIRFTVTNFVAGNRRLITR